ncbi:hypothetical protein DFH06DRAFT_1195391 [Mycena polygramma]|nr:hypothetical protein DFH06DRAFT_1195391 [Mycena polygramma]
MLPSLEADRARVAELEVQILELERSLSALRTAQALVQDRLNSYTYAVLTLPSELVSEIFINFLPTYPSPPPLYGSCSPCLVTQICQRWRQIALATPALWRTISISGHDARELAPIHIWLRRSKHCPLLIKVKAAHSAPHVSEALTAFFAHRSRWEQVDFEAFPSHLSTIEGPLPLPLLRCLHLSLYETPASTIATFSDAPMLRTAFLNYAAAAKIALPWAQLTSLTLSWVIPEEWVPVLQQTVNLVHCSLEVTRGGTGDPPADIKLVCLKSLALKARKAVDGCLETFIFPALHHLEVPESFLGANPIETLSSFISKSGCKLHEIRIIGATEVLIDSYRQAFPSIPNVSFQLGGSRQSVEVQGSLHSA